MNYHTILLPKFLNVETIAYLKKEQLKIQREPKKILLVKGENDFFCHGLDFGWLLKQEFDIQTKLLSDFIEFLDFLHYSPFVSIAIITGSAVGGGVGLAAACDIVLAKQTSYFQLTEGLFGLVPEIILPVLLTRCSMQLIKYLVFSADKFLAVDAEKMGLVNQTAVDEESLHILVETWIKKITRCHPQSIKDIKIAFPDKNLSTNMALQHIKKTGAPLLSKQLKKTTIQNALKEYIDFGIAPWQIRESG